MSVEINLDTLTTNEVLKNRDNENSLTDLFEKSARKRRAKNTIENTVSTNKVNKTAKKAVRTTSKSVTAIAAEKQKWLFDPWVIVIAMSIITLGIIMVGSASISIAERNNGEPFYYLYLQLIATGLGLFLGSLVLITPIKIWQKTGPIILFIGVFLLIAVLLPGVGREINGSSRWIPMGIFNLQVSELVKLAMVIYLAGYLVRHSESVRKTIKGFFMPMVVLAAVAVLLLMEPDLGATVVISVTALGMLFLGGVRLWQFLVLMLIMAVSVYYLIILEPYRLERLQSFMNPWADPFDTGFQLTQSLIAFGRGELTGVGLGNSIQKLFYLPEGHTDFLFAVLAEELGGIGAITVIALFAALVSRIFVLAKRAEQVKKTFSAYMMFGLGIWIGLQAFVNIAVNMGVLPTKGLTLPLMSYGGSSMMIMCIVIALILRAEHETRFKYPLGSGFLSALTRRDKKAKKSF
ncbi:MAG: putative lipid II flippase FtsW [gamma proteobacterium symbiont of Lucinoma myriamae]|nr:putative lipid II flippase FtsW [gamma proteobacterium symbiont of Lucinoma myriamae]MCU7818890.1 putative lipid II flippase FtsW [gamma proteobacterium symbiont of Lucinoma myriamae]MCU7831061.1 putative lipid II flippase FtsW [gamma proteobacterium symbiont of Lucinoma myriamae]